MTKEETKLTDPLTNPLTERRGSMADYMVAGIESPFIDAAAARIPIIGQNQIARGLTQLTAGFVLSKQNAGTSNSIVKTVKTGTEIAFAATGAANITAGVAVMAQNIFNKNQTQQTTESTYEEW